MELYLQFGHGMIGHSKELLGRWRGGGVILSPRDADEDQIKRVAAEALSVGAEPLLDPQCYVRDADDEDLVAQQYWGAIRKHATGAFTGGPGTDALLSALETLAASAGITTHIAPCVLAAPVDDVWLDMQTAVLAAARKHFDGEVLATVALSSDALLDEDQVDMAVEAAAAWDVDGYYVVVQVPDAYLVDNPVWIAHLLILCGGLRLHGRRVVVGYAHHQMLCLAAANVDTMACGTFLNVRAFDPDKFYERDEGDISRRATWYYGPGSLSEYKIPFLDIAQSAGVLDLLRPSSRYDRVYSDPLFGGAPPSTVNWREPDAFRHYLHTLRQQVAEQRGATFADTITAYRGRLDAAEKLMQKLAKHGVRGQDRDFGDMIDVNRAGLAKFEAALGGRLRRSFSR